MLRVLSISWLAYFFRSNFTIMLKSLPFVGSSKIMFRPAGWHGSLIFTTVVQLLIYLPLFLMIATYLNVQIFQPGFLVVVAFGIFMGIVFRSIVDKSLTFLEYDGLRLRFEVFGFYEKMQETIPTEAIKGITQFESSHTDSRNYKICFVINDGRLILAYVTQWKFNFKSQWKKLTKLSNLPIVEYPGGEPINDMNVGRVTI